MDPPTPSGGRACQIRLNYPSGFSAISNFFIGEHCSGARGVKKAVSSPGPGPQSIYIYIYAFGPLLCWRPRKMKKSLPKHIYIYTAGLGAVPMSEGPGLPQIDHISSSRSGVQTGQSGVHTGVQTGQSEVQKTPRWSPKGSDMVLDGPNVDPKLPKAAGRASGMVWGSRSKCLSQDF